MSLFVVQHRHSPETCPAKDKQLAPMLVKHLSQQNADRSGIRIHSEAVIDGAHTLYIILEASNREAVNRFMQPFSQVGSVEILQASHCETVVERGAC
ncbi:MAG: sulfite oxidase [Ignavibacteriales bacterium]|nr:sulfite oxidase [Ignavibacteriales bacterium]